MIDLVSVKSWVLVVASNHEVVVVVAAAVVAVAVVDEACNVVVGCRKMQAEEFGRMHLVRVGLE